MSDGVIAKLDELIELRRYARKVQTKPLRPASGIGGHLSRLRGRGMDFAEARNYQAGDEIRHMEWRVTARTGRPHIKVYQEERERPVVILTDFNPSMYFGTRTAFKSVVAARLSAMIGWTAVKQGDRVGGLICSATHHHEFMPRGRESGILPWLACLSDYTGRYNTGAQQSPRGLSDALTRLRRVVKPGSILVLISDFYHLDADSEKHLSRLRAHNDVLVYQLLDPLEISPPKPAVYGLSNGSEDLLIDLRLQSVCQEYQAFFDQRARNLKDFWQRLQIQHQTVLASDDIPLLVRQTFPRRSNA